MVHQWGFFGSISAIRKICSLTANSRSLQAAALKRWLLNRGSTVVIVLLEIRDSQNLAKLGLGAEFLFIY